MTKRIFRSICLAAMTVLLAGLMLVMGMLYNYFTGVQFGQLRVETALAAHALTNEGMDYFTGLDDTTSCRITWIGVDGTVLYDSRTNTGSMENHLAREEVQQALVSGYGQSSRYSDTHMEHTLYAAELLPDGTVLRLSVSRNSVLNLVLDMAQPIVLVVCLALLLSLYLAHRLSRSIVEPLNELNLSEPLSNRGYEEIAPLLRRMDAQQNQLRAQQRALVNKQKEFNTVTRHLSEGLVLLNTEGTVLSINPAGAALLEATPNCAGADFAAVCTNAQLLELAEKALTGVKGEQTLTLHDGEYLVMANPVKADGLVSGAALLLMDITEKRKAEALRREFTANVSHELKTPLHAISGYAELMQGGLVKPEDQPVFAGKIYSETQRLIRLVEDTLRLSRLDEGAGDMQWVESDLFDQTQAVTGNLQSSAELAGVHLSLEGSPAVIRCIPQLVSGVIFNLTDNAIKYNRPGGSVTVRVEPRETGAVLTVTDTGIGIRKEDLGRIFERFYRVDRSHSKQVGGTGLGLSIVKHSAAIHNAEITVSSTPGKGTIVSVIFP